METMHNRYLATAHLTDKMLLTLPEAVVTHLGLKVLTRAPRDTRYTDDSVVSVPARTRILRIPGARTCREGVEGPAGGGPRPPLPGPIAAPLGRSWSPSSAESTPRSGCRGWRCSSGCAVRAAL